MRTLSWLLSILLHACVALAGIYLATPGEMRVSLDVPVYTVDLVQLAPKKGRLPEPKPKAEAPKPAQPKAEPAPAAPAPKPEPKAEPKPEAKAIAAKPAKPKVTEIPKKETPKAEKKPEPKPAPKKPAKPQKTKEQELKEALAQARRDAKWKERKEAEERDKALAEALKQAEADAALAEARDAAKAETGEEVGAGGTDPNGAMLGLKDIYAAQVKELIRANWRYPNIPVDQSLVAGVFIRVGPDGYIREYSLLARSGRADFDESVLKAVEETEKLPPPPGDISEIRINFNLQDIR